MQRANPPCGLQGQCTTKPCSRTAHPRTWPADQLSGDTVKETRRQDIANVSHGASFRKQQSNSYRSSLSSQVKSKRQVKADQRTQESNQGIVCCKKTIINTVELESNEREKPQVSKRRKNRPRQAKDRSKSPVIQVKTGGERRIFGSTKEALEIVGRNPSIALVHVHLSVELEEADKDGNNPFPSHLLQILSLRNLNFPLHGALRCQIQKVRTASLQELCGPLFQSKENQRDISRGRYLWENAVTDITLSLPLTLPFPLDSVRILVP